MTTITRRHAGPTSWQRHEADRIAHRHGPHRWRMHDGRMLFDLLAYRSTYAPPALTLVLNERGHVVDRVEHDPVEIPNVVDFDDLDRRVLDECVVWIGPRGVARALGERLAVVRPALERLHAADILEIRRKAGSGNIEYRTVPG